MNIKRGSLPHTPSLPPSHSLTCMYVLMQSKGMDTITAATPEAAPAVKSQAYVVHMSCVRECVYVVCPCLCMSPCARVCICVCVCVCVCVRACVCVGCARVGYVRVCMCVCVRVRV